MSASRRPAARRRHEELAGFLAGLSHELRSSLNGIKSWTHVLEHRLGDADPLVRRALDGILIGVDQQVRVLENLLGETGVEASFRRLAMTKRNDAQPDIADDQRHEERPNRPEPDPDTIEGPGGRKGSKAEEDARNQTTRRGER